MSGTVAELVRSRRLQKGLTQSELALETGLRQAYISQVEKGEIAIPRDPQLDKLGAALDLSRADFYRAAGRFEGMHPDPPDAPPARSFDDILRELEAERPIAVPVIEQVASAGRGEAAIGYVYLPPMGRRRPGLFAMRVRGQCMSPRIEDGDTIIVDREAPAEVGKIVLAVAGDNWDLVLVKRLVEREGRRWLEPLQGQAIVIDGSVRIVGVVMQIISEA